MSWCDDVFEIEKSKASAGEIPVMKCECCGSGIYVGDDYFKVGNETYCDDCCEECEAEIDDFPEPDWDSMRGGHDDI